MMTIYTMIVGLALIEPISAFYHPTNHRSTKTNPTQLDLYASVEQAISEAQNVCSQYGSDSEQCKVAWDIVEELEAADSHRTDTAVALASSWEEKQVNYLPLLEGMDILSAKLDRKLYELNNLSRQLAEAGAGEEIEALVYASEEMRGLLENAKRKVQELKG
eukprot:scaffold2726_cov57-Cyclotella_meneghiniana.AAC.6